ncbi:MAG: 1-deoxy-D-xylulose-5-phosphate reductoisomerase [Aestuariibacter sp.]
MRNICILGATGSIGESTLDVIQRHPERFNVVALTGHSNLHRLVQQAVVCKPEFLVCARASDYNHLKELVQQAGLSCEVMAGAEALVTVATLPQIDTVMAAIVGAAGLNPTYQAACHGKRVLLANKEALVMSGKLFTDAVHRYDAQLLPVDSEHNAIFQCLPVVESHADKGVTRILLTGSGGPFLTTPIEQFAAITPEQACRHPNWSMGRKISVDSATMMNKGLEFVEAKWLFQDYCQDIDIVIHPQSIIHSMVQMADGSVLAQMGNPDMRTPIAHVLDYPHRIVSGVAPLNFYEMGDLTFTAPDFSRFPCLQLAIQASELGQLATTALNAANEVAVDAFLEEKIRYTDIVKVCEYTLEHLPKIATETIEDIVSADQETRRIAKQYSVEMS